MENSIEYFYEKLKTAQNPGSILATYLCSLYETEPKKSEIIMCNKLIGIFGRFTVFFSITDMAGSYEKIEGNPYPLLYTICKRRFESAHTESFVTSHKPLNGFLKDVNEALKDSKKSKKKIPSSEGL